MFKHILFPTDGAATSKHIVKQCIAFAKGIGAQVTALHVMPKYSPYAYQAAMLVETLEDFNRECVEAANEFLDEVRNQAAEAGVKCEGLYVTSDFPYDAIIRTAEEKGCDVIVMASHGRKGVKGMILGSETQKVLTHSKLPVLVFR
ncbi:MAG TPA: universal stress protein [Burkholderiaceae bacterium]|jgi:nucleotide-binding universal stress UspA family protein